MKTEQASLTEGAREFADLVNRVRFDTDLAIELRRFGKPVAVLVGHEQWLQLLEASGLNGGPEAKDEAK